MSDQNNLQPGLRQKANEILSRLALSERQALLIKTWMSHDARWFMAVADEYGMAAANRLNKIAAHEVGKVEAQRMVRALQSPPVTSLDEYLLMQEVFITFLGPDLLDYGIRKVSDDAYQIHVQRCFAYDNAVRAGIAEHYECGILARVAGWFDALNLKYALRPTLGQCLSAHGQECIYTISIESRIQNP